MTTRRTSSRPDCGYTFRDVTCGEAGEHFCVPRADRAQAFIEELLPHTKGKWARRPFILTGWQSDGIVRPLFGTVVWSDEHDRYVRRYRLAWIELARKNGKSELDAAIALLLLVGDDEESAEIYGCAVDRDQARKVFDVAARMVKLSATLSKRLTVKAHAKRIVDEQTGSYYEVIASDAAGNLGHNPHGVIFDEVLTQKSGDLWDSLRTAMGTRVQPLMVGTTTAGSDPASFAARQHQEMARVAEDPGRAPHVFVFMRNTPRDADPWDEANWAQANPALGDFLSVEALRQEALEARNDPAKENAFRQFRLNQWVQQSTRWMPLHVWDAAAGEIAATPDWVDGRLSGRCFGGLDLSSTTDLTALAWLFPDVEGGAAVLWRFWLPESQVAVLDRYTGGQMSVWVRDGWVTATDGDVIDYDAVYDQFDVDRSKFKIVDVSYDRWMAEPVRQELARRKVDGFPVGQGFGGISHPMKELMRLVKSGELRHFGNPVARWMVDAVEVKRDDAENIKPVKPARDKSGKRIDGVVALAMAIDGWMRRGQKKRQHRATAFL